ncbi:50S ribosomal protein L31 [Candidatus Curtissbacteria bacterium RIFCSPHIGHO2_12_FULL_38_9b]|uniref:Large ribosomal subunit protein bL31 n=2 Tax=Candidatus Curtissiibacteriota TaxID=1752717 RepID=A0A1F5GYP8_9BACT|nr:MAG: 50S ribosomal protein L31 [Candidatus Curtissbacteria bacterium RIFCSPLOWO2_01_FULL_37_9]OGD96991.1 MAG: 50S ribosomal protein L31 [Candidatus Curtissbacteria bacterium RIFCSPHIGHO2_12_FULL_38_9b]
MKANIHPQFFESAKINCVCGNSFTLGSTLSEMKVDVCNKCHPFFTGEMKYVDTLGRVERFQKKQAQAKALKIEKAKKIQEKKKTIRPDSLREMIDLAKKQASS